MATTTKTEPDAFECVLAFSLDVDGAPRNVRHGELVAPDDPAYLAAPEYFVAPGTPHAARPTLVDFVTVAGTQTAPGVRRPDGWRREHGEG
jgi:hypothetical protein